MKKILCLGVIFIITQAWADKKTLLQSNSNYDPNYVETSTVTYDNEVYSVVQMKREGDRIKAKYFAAEDYNGKTVPTRYATWSSGKDIILVSSGTYMDNTGTPVGLTIDNGVMVNNTLSSEMDGLVIVYATGGIVVSNLDDGDLTFSACTDIAAGAKLNIRKSAFDLQKFISCAKKVEATVFQTHLLVYKNELKISATNSSQNERERRYLAVGTDEDGKIFHVIVHNKNYHSLYDGAKNTLAFLNNFKDINVTFMINLDTGAQDVFKLYDSDGTINTTVKGTMEVSSAVNLLSYYYQ